MYLRRAAAGFLDAEFDLVLQRVVEETVRAAASVKPFDDQEIFPL